MDPREEDGFGRGEVREIDEASIAGDCCGNTEYNERACQPKVSIPDYPQAPN